MSELVILKLGGSVITKKSEDLAEVDQKNLDRISAEIAEALSEGSVSLVIVHGAGAFGHIPAKKYRLHEGVAEPWQIEGVAATRKSVLELNHLVVESLINAGVNAVAFTPSDGGVLDGGRIIEFPTESVKKLLESGAVPVAYGDVLSDKKRKYGILSGDQLVTYLAAALSAARVVVACDVDGIFDRDPAEDGAKKLDVLNRAVAGSVSLSGSKGTDVTGGMKGKVEELVGLGEDGITSHVISGLTPGNVKKALLGGTGFGTIIR